MAIPGVKEAPSAGAANMLKRHARPASESLLTEKEYLFVSTVQIKHFLLFERG